eukprot:2309851-Pleurochrysis_carterae.AAC.1
MEQLRPARCVLSCSRSENSNAMASTAGAERARLARVPERSDDRGSGPSRAEGAPPGRLAGMRDACTD